MKVQGGRSYGQPGGAVNRARFRSSGVSADGIGARRLFLQQPAGLEDEAEIARQDARLVGRESPDPVRLSPAAKPMDDAGDGQAAHRHLRGKESRLGHNISGRWGDCPPRFWDILVLLTLFLVAPGCESAGDGRTTSTARPRVERDRLVFPLDEGRTWVYAPAGGGKKVTVRSEAEADPRAVRLRIVGSEDATFARLRWDDRDLVMGSGGKSPGVVLLRLPARAESVWTAAPGVRAKVLRDERISVPAGTFDCIVVALSGAGASERYWIAHGVGFVRVLRERGGRREEATLVSTAPPLR
jgi:hypothetical protein